VSTALEQLRRHPAIWRRQAPPGSALPTGFPALDAVLPDGGWSMGALTEILIPREGVGELRLVLPALADLSARGRWLAWVGPPYVPYAPALEARGIVLSRLLWVRGRNSAQQLWSAEQALRCGACAAVLAWPTRVAQRRLRRLQLAAENGGAWALLFYHQAPPSAGSPASLRLRVAPAGPPADNRLAVEVLKCRGRPGARVEISLGD
jgi:hypothetical protein